MCAALLLYLSLAKHGAYLGVDNMTAMYAALTVAIVANIAAVMAIIFARFELSRAERAIESVSLSLESRRMPASAASLASSASIQERTSSLRTECGVEPCRSVVAISSLAAAGPIFDRRNSSSGGIGMSAPFDLVGSGLNERSGSRVETPNVEANRHFAVGRVWARLLKPKPGPPQSVRLSDQLGRAA